MSVEDKSSQTLPLRCKVVTAIDRRATIYVQCRKKEGHCDLHLAFHTVRHRNNKVLLYRIDWEVSGAVTTRLIR